MTNLASTTEVYDVIVVGAGNAGFSAASTACQTLRSPLSNTNSAPRVLLLEKAPRATTGGNTFYTAGAYRFCFDDLTDLRRLVSYNGDRGGLPDTLADRIDVDAYRDIDFMRDMDRVTGGRADSELSKVLVGQSREAVDWIADNGGCWELSFHRQAYEVEGRWKFWGGLVVCFRDGGKGLVKWHEDFADKEGVEVRYGCAVTDLVVEDGVGRSRVVGVTVTDTHGGDKRQIYSRGGVVLATGGFQANSTLRARWLGESWTAAHVRGSPTNTGDGHEMTLLSAERKITAKAAGHYEGCHSVCWDASSPEQGGDRVLTNQYTKSGYPLGIMVNSHGQRFVDEGKDLRNYTYAIFGKEVLKQPGGIAWQVWDADGAALLRVEEYDASVTELIVAEDMDVLVEKLARSGMEDTHTFRAMLDEFNEACGAFGEEFPDVKFDPAERDGLSTQSSTKTLELPKSNWARPLVKPPFTAVKVTCGVTFTFGGLAVDAQTAGVISADGDGGQETEEKENRVVPGLYCCGELMGGLFWGNYPGGSGLTAGTVFGRIAGKHAAEMAMKGEGD